jgi:membrane-associated protease RseP (regulator of RpoE activity)
MGIGGTGPLPDSGTSELDRLRRTVSSYFPVYESRLGPQSVLFAVHADPAGLGERFDRLRRELWTQGYIPVLRQVQGEQFVEVLRRPKTGRTRLWINLLLIAGTLATTTFAGALIWLTYVGGMNLTAPDFVNGDLYFALPVMAILGLHEFAHYVMARRRHLDASLPYFIPVPPPFLFGTLGAFVSIREPFPDKKALFDIGAAGPLAGFAASIPIALAGLYLSIHAPVLPLTYCGPTVLGQSYGNLLIGNSLFWTFLSYFVPSNLVSLHPLALAGWVGIFVTAINLLPAGQLDGGHIFRALFGDRTRFVSYGVVVLLFGLGILYTGWWFFAILVLLTGLRHPPPLNDVSPLGPHRQAVGALVLAILVTGFVIVPLSATAGTVSMAQPSYTVPSLHPPGIAANISAEVTNGDPISHGYSVSTSITNVSVGNGTTFLTGAALASWAANTTWSFVLPSGGTFNATGATFALPAADYVTIGGMDGTQTIRFDFYNPGSAYYVTVQVNLNQYCATSGGGSASRSVSFP